MQVLGISGSPVNNSNTDRLVKTVLEATGLDYKFIKLSEYHIHPCRACLGCSKDNICRQKDDWHIVENKIKECSIKEKSERQSQSWSGGEYQA